MKVDFGSKQAVVTVVADKCDEKALLKALDKEGFKGEVVKDAPKAKAPPTRQVILSVSGMT